MQPYYNVLVVFAVFCRVIIRIIVKKCAYNCINTYLGGIYYGKR